MQANFNYCTSLNFVLSVSFVLVASASGTLVLQPLRQRVRQSEELVMGSDRMGFGGENERLPGPRDGYASGSEDEGGDARDVDMAPRLSNVAMDSDDEAGALGTQRYRGRAPMRAATTARDRFLSDDTDIEEEMMRIDPVDLEWRRQLHVGDPVDAQNVFGNWCPALVLRILDGEVQVRYLNMNESWNRWLPTDSGQLAQPATKTRNDSAPLRLAQVVEVRRANTTLWKEAHVVKARPSDLLVRYAGRQQQFDEWLPFTPDNVAAAGDHIRNRPSYAEQRRFSVKPNANNRLRVIQAQNPRFQHYRDSLGAHGLRIHTVEGDGNCLFRSVSHQIYGDDSHHGLVRRMCMDYMESEKEYFEPYVVGDMSAFLRYLQHKRRDGVWGDDPEIQAICELYDRPAEVYAYDPTHGFRKLRTFHENSSLSRNRPPIRLSYYGGGHYDSIVSPEHDANLIHEPPGEWEQRHIEISRRINTREGGATGADSATISGQRVVESAQSRDATEMAQLEQILMISRNEFDAMRSNLDDTLKRALEESQASAADSEQRALDVATQESEMAAIQAQLIEKARQASEEEQMRKALEASMKDQSFHVGSGDFDAEVSAAIQASLVEHGALAPAESGGFIADEEDEMRRILELSAKEYEDTTREFVASTVAAPPAGLDFTYGEVEDADEMDELQRAIQASLEQS